MDVQKRIRDLMKLRGWTDYRLAKEASLSHSTVTNMFNRNNAPTLPTLEAVCRAFGITLAQFFADEVDPAQLTDEQRTLFARWSSLTERQKNLLLDLMETMGNPPILFIQNRRVPLAYPWYNETSNLLTKSSSIRWNCPTT